ncbi:MAG TPA: nitroreductase [Pseudohongiella sp.]|nr:nitroreductase [Pseudohongiella sp.]
MDALIALQTRVSAPRVKAPAPDRQTLEQIFKAAFRTADHGLLKPWRFLVIQGQSLQRFADLFAAAVLADKPDSTETDISSIRNKALRAPLVVVGIACPKAAPKVPESEQLLSAGGALQNMLTAAFALGVGAIWRTGPMATHPVVMQGLGLQPGESIIGFVYMGTVDGTLRPLVDEPVDAHVQDW